MTAPFPAVLRGSLETRSKRQIIHLEIDVKSWTLKPPSCAAARPSSCPVCDAASREPGRALVIVGHGLRERTVDGPLAPDEQAVATSIVTRRYRCRACDAILIVAPRGIGPRYRYSLSAIAWALAQWAYARVKAATVRARVSTAMNVGAASATRWASLQRWTRCALALFGTQPGELGTLRERAACIASFVAAHAPIITGPVPHDAFYGAAFCPSR